MDALHVLFSRLRAIWRRGRAERDLNDEVRFHIEMETEKNVRSGMGLEEARRRALVSFGALDSHKEAVRDDRTFRWLEDAFTDARYTLRGLRRAPGFAAVAVLTVGIGVGATAAIFTVVNAALLRPLPYPDSDRLAVIYSQNRERNLEGVNVSWADYQTWKASLESFERLGIFNWTSYTLSGDGVQAERVTGAEVDADLFPVLGTEPLLGRGVRSDEVVEGRNRVAVLGYGLWQRRFGGDANVIGRTIQVDGFAHEIVGVMPPGFQFPYSGELWTPMAPNSDFVNRSVRFLAGVVGRLEDGVTREYAETELARVSELLQREFPDSNTGWEGQFVSLREDLFGMLRPAMLIVFAAAALVLLIVCGNLASLLLARSAARSDEIALRSAIGAGRGRLLRQFVTESLVLTLIGGLAGLGLGYWGVAILRGLLSDRLPAFIYITPDARVYAFGGVTVALVALLTGVLPSLQSLRMNALAFARDGRRSTAGPHGARLRSVLVVAEVGLAVVLLVGSGLLIKSMNALTRIDPGFDADRVLTARYNLLAPEYEDAERQAVFQAELLDRLRTLPGVERVAAAQGTPFSGWNLNTSYDIEGVPPPPVGQSPGTHFQAITPDYFNVIGVPLLDGRMLSATDESDGVPVAVVNASFVARNFPVEDAVGKRFRLCCGEDSPWVTVVGVIADYRHYALTEPMGPAVYIPYSQFVRSQMTLAIRTAGRPEDLIPSLNTVMAELDPDVPAHRIQTLEEVLARQTWVQRIARDILTAFAAVAGLLSVIGLYGVIAYSVARQRREIGVHLALGAAPRDVLRLIVRRGLSLALTGIAIGWTIALLAAQWLQQLLFQVQPADVATFTFVPLVVAVLATVATWIPARHAAATDPVVALRAE